jgi:hypothetical protein
VVLQVASAVPQAELVVLLVVLAVLQAGLVGLQAALVVHQVALVRPVLLLQAEADRELVDPDQAGAAVPVVRRLDPAVQGCPVVAVQGLAKAAAR